METLLVDAEVIDSLEAIAQPLLAKGVELRGLRGDTQGIS
jgi:hypothetical protein